MASGDRLAPIIIFSVLFIALTLAVVPQMVDIFYANNINSTSPTKHIGYTMIGGHQYQMWTVTSAGGATNYSVNGSVTEWHSWTDQLLNNELLQSAKKDEKLNTRAHFIFYDQSSNPPSHHRMDIWIVRNNTGYLNHLDDLQSTDPFIQTNAMRDFVFFREYAYSGAIWDNNHNFYDVVSFAQLTNPLNQIENTNMSQYSILGKYNTTFFSGPNPKSTEDLINATYQNQFTIQVGSDLMNMMTRAHIGMWNIVGDLFMFKSDELGMPLWLNMFISTILWICVGFAVLGVISRFIPTIPGL